jgi:hypothetical protein
LKGVLESAHILVHHVNEYDFQLRRQRMNARLLVLALPSLVAACASPTAPAESTPREGAVADIRTHACGRCHMPPEPKTRTRLQLETTITRHRARVRLSDDDWGKLVDYLAQRDSR